MKKRNIGVLISGRGTNLQALIDATDSDSKFPGEIKCVVSNRRKAFGLKRAEKAGIDTAIFHEKKFSSREEHEFAILEYLKEKKIELIVLAGYMRVLSSSFFELCPCPIINIHPALLPSFPGIHAQEQALKYGVRVTGASVHFVSAEVDGGPLILQEAIAIDPASETVDEISARLLPIEHQLLTRAVRLWCEGRLRVEGRIVRILEDV